MPQPGRKPDAGRTASAEELCHPIGVGETVLIVRSGAGLPSRIEGRAVVLAAAPEPHRYLIQFSSDPAPKIRFVWPEGHPDAEASAGNRHALPRADADAHPEIADFFPEADH